MRLLEPLASVAPFALMKLICAGLTVSANWPGTVDRNIGHQ